MHFLSRRAAASAAFAISAALALVGCGTTEPGATNADAMDVVVAFYPLEYVTERVGGDQVHITNLTQPGADAHDVALTPRQVALLSEADLVVYQRGFQPEVDEAIVQAQPANVVDMATVVDFHTIDATGSHVHDGADSDGEHTHGEDQHAHGNLDPHAWLDPTNMVAMTQATAEALSTARPASQSAFAANAAALEADLTALDESYQEGLATCERTEFIVSHAAFGYLAERYGLVQIPIRGLTPDNEPSPARIAEVQQLAQDHQITTIFYETLVSPAVSESMARDLNLRTDVLDPLEGLTGQSRGDDYLEIMEANLQALQEASGCL